MAKKRIKINGHEYTDWTPEAGYEAKTIVVTGGNAMTMANGARFKDEVALMSGISVPFLPLTDAQLAVLTQDLYTNTTCTVWFFDPDLNAYRTIIANRELSKRKHKGQGADGNDYWTPVVVTFEETL